MISRHREVSARGRSATAARVAARLAAALRGAPCVVSGREARGRGNPARVRRARPPATAPVSRAGGRINHVVSMPPRAAHRPRRRRRR